MRSRFQADLFFTHFMEFKTIFIGLIFLISFCSCEFSMYASNYDFETTAIYVAPKSKSTAVVLTKGYVPKGADLGDENQCLINSRITFSEKPNDIIKISSNGLKVFTVLINDKQLVFKDSNSYISILLQGAKDLGIVKIDSTELEEFGRVILSTGYGPKGTILKGQSQTIFVDTVRYSTKNR